MNECGMGYQWGVVESVEGGRSDIAVPSLPSSLPSMQLMSGAFVDIGQVLRQADPLKIVTVDDRLTGALADWGEIAG